MDDRPVTAAIEESIDCRAFHQPLNEGSLTDFHPPRPLRLLPYYHGRMRFDVANRLLKQQGDYALFIDPVNDQLLLCLRDDADKYYKQPIVRRPQALFGIDGSMSHHQQGFPNVQQLIAYYEVYGLPVKDEKLPSGKYVRLDTGVQIREDMAIPEESLRPFKEPDALDHFHFVLSKEDAEKRLGKEGDFLLRQDPAKPTDFIVSVRGANDVSHHVLEREPSSGVNYVLPRQNPSEPVESVHFLDEFVQLHVLYALSMDGKRLTNPVSRPNA